MALKVEDLRRGSVIESQMRTARCTLTSDPEELTDATRLRHGLQEWAGAPVTHYAGVYGDGGFDLVTLPGLWHLVKR